MSVLKLLRRLGRLWSRRRLDAELDEELAFHLEMDVRRHLAAGLSPREAYRRARVDFGAVQNFREETRDMRGTGTLVEMIRDWRYGLRALARRPLASTLLLFTLSLGIGGSAAIFGVVHGVLLAPLPYKDADGIVTLWELDPRTGARDEVAPGTFLDWRARTTSFSTVTALEHYGLDWASPEGPIYLPTYLAYEGFFETFGVRPFLGRTPRADEYVAGRADVVVLGYDIWKTRFGSDREIAGRVVTIDGRPFEIIGVMPRGFAMPDDGVVWAPKVVVGWEPQARRGGYYQVFGRLAPGVTLSTAESEMAVVSRQLADEYPGSAAAAAVEPLADRIVGPVRQPLFLLLGAVVLVFFIVVANAGSLELARAIARTREFAVRGALGASQGRLTRQRLAESAAVAMFGAVLGFGVAWLATRALRAAAPVDFPRLTELDGSTTILVLAVVGSGLAALAIGVAPATLARADRISLALGATSRGASQSRRVGRLQGGLVVTQMALCLTLLVGTSLLLRSFTALLDNDRGFATEGVAVLTVQSWDHFKTPAARAEFVRQATNRLHEVPGVTAAGVSSSVPMMESIGSEHATLGIEGQPQSGEPPFVQFAAVTPGFFEALEVPVVSGRPLAATDVADAPAVAVVNAAFVRRYLPATNPIGTRLRLGTSRAGQTPQPVEIVGVVGDVRRSNLADPPVPWVYRPHAQIGTGANAFVVAGTVAPAALLESIRQVIWGINPAIPVYQETTMAALVGASVKARQFVLVIVGVFAGMALVLAAAGLYALMNFMAEERTREMGVRMALGADRSSVVRLVVRRGLALTVAGMAVGLLGAYLASRSLAGMLYDVGPTDPVTYVGAPLLLLATALVACWIPARRAAAADPIAALRSE